MQHRIRIGIYGLSMESVYNQAVRLTADGLAVRAIRPAFLVVDVAEGDIDKLREFLEELPEWPGRPASSETISKFFSRWRCHLVWLYK